MKKCKKRKLEIKSNSDKNKQAASNIAILVLLNREKKLI